MENLKRAKKETEEFSEEMRQRVEKAKNMDISELKGTVLQRFQELTDDEMGILESLDQHPVGEVIKGKVVNMMNYGAFVELEEGVEGLIHVSEMSWIRHVKHPSDIFNLGDEVEAKILNIDKADKKTVRRNEVYTASGRMSKYKRFEIVLYIGDAMGDFPKKDFDKFGNNQIILPNPMYGKW